MTPQAKAAARQIFIEIFGTPDPAAISSRQRKKIEWHIEQAIRVAMAQKTK